MYLHQVWHNTNLAQQVETYAGSSELKLIFMEIYKAFSFFIEISNFTRYLYYFRNKNYLW